MKHKRNGIIDLKIRRLKLFALVFVVAGLALLRVSFAQADTVSMYMTADDDVLDINQVTTLSLRLNTAGQNVDGVEAHLAYNSGQLEFVSIEPAGSAFSVELGAQTGGNGTVDIVRGSFSPVSGDVLIANVKFKALIGSSDTTVDYSASSNVTGGGSYLNPSKSGMYYQLGSPPPPEPPPEEPPATPPPENNPPSSSTGNTNAGNNNTSNAESANSSGGADTTAPPPEEPSASTTTTGQNKTTTSTPLPDSIDRLPTTGFIARHRTWFITGGALVALTGGGLYGAALYLHRRSLNKPVLSRMFTSSAKPTTPSGVAGSKAATPPTQPKPSNEVFYPESKPDSNPPDEPKT